MTRLPTLAIEVCNVSVQLFSLDLAHFHGTRSKISSHAFATTMSVVSIAGAHEEQRDIPTMGLSTSCAQINKIHECFLQRLPAEIRNEIFHLALAKDKPVEMTNPWPGLTGTCKQLREEALSIYFGSNTFIARVTDLRGKHITAWLRRIEHIPLALKALIPTFTIVVEGRIIDMTIVSHNPMTWVPNERPWDKIVSQLSTAGLTAEQLRWPSSLLAGMASHIWADRSSFECPIRLAANSTLLYNEILPALLKQHGLFDSSRPPPDVTGSLLSRSGFRVVLWLKRWHYQYYVYQRGQLLDDAVQPWWVTTKAAEEKWQEFRENEGRKRKDQEILAAQQAAASQAQARWAEQAKMLRSYPSIDLASGKVTVQLEHMQQDQAQREEEDKVEAARTLLMLRYQGDRINQQAPNPLFDYGPRP